MYRRFAIYVTPEGDLGRVGAAWLGWDILAGRSVEHPVPVGIDCARITKRPRKYGLHATVKPPMALRDGATPEALESAAGQIAKDIAPLELSGLEVSQIRGFLALTPRGDTRELDRLASIVVAQLDRFRTPPSSEELARRRKRRLTVSQEANLTRWGYPHVMEDYRFHITLTGPLKDADQLRPVVAAHFAPVLSEPFVIDHLSIAGEAEDGMFHRIARLPLGGKD